MGKTLKKQRFNVILGAGKIKTSWVNKHWPPFIINTAVPDLPSEWRWSKGLVWCLAFSLVHVHKYRLNPPEAQKEQMWCFFLTADVPLTKHSLSAQRPSAALRTRRAVSPSVDESPGIVRKTRWAWDTWPVQRSEVAGACKVWLFKCKLYTPVLPRRRHTFSHANLQTC